MKWLIIHSGKNRKITAVFLECFFTIQRVNICVHLLRYKNNNKYDLLASSFGVTILKVAFSNMISQKLGYYRKRPPIHLYFTLPENFYVALILKKRQFILLFCFTKYSSTNLEKSSPITTVKLSRLLDYC